MTDIVITDEHPTSRDGEIQAAECSFSAPTASAVRRAARDWAREFAADLGAGQVYLRIGSMEASTDYFEGLEDASRVLRYEAHAVAMVNVGEGK